MKTPPIRSLDLLSYAVRHSLASVQADDEEAGRVVTFDDGSTGRADKNLWLLVSSKLFTSLLLGMLVMAVPIWFASEVSVGLGHLLLALGVFAIGWPTGWIVLFQLALALRRLTGAHEGSVIVDTMQVPSAPRVALVTVSAAVAAVAVATTMSP